MFIVESYPIAIIMCFITMICWGSWANTTKLVSNKKWEFPLFYWDYSLGVLLCSLLFAFTLGSIGEEGRSFISDIQQADINIIFLPILAGMIFNVSNILLVASISLAGMAVAFPVGVGLALVLGVITTYIGSPQGDPTILFLGVACVVAAIILTAITYSRVTQSSDKSRRNKGLITAIFAGIIMGSFFRFLAQSISGNLSEPEAGLMTPYSALVLFALGLFLSNFVLNTLVMKKPIVGEPVKGKMYFSGSLRDHLCGWLGGIIWCIGLGLSLIASGQAGYAISYGLGQGATMIAVIWGVFVWREFASAPAGTNKLLLAMFLLYIAGIILIIAANQ
ncbi:multidrug DMT transporter permease [Providencia rettgeri]|uniref:multidrug DMT transporter permease n=1 Tax=Providencia rettgeri TaxID=587 RepID=UPI001B35DB0A|nr:multidrug DMT transporter permease [Providencia rettgeri]EJD6507391.1 multidrug DMT transporter permease [Providencia rettgeri]MBQ0314866.1 multidrug DMT transporter permease [Providencia rettgeri]MBQ0323705.1 multidrug DMT transporter permease [Providencia rettgeri]MBQ0352257.1 multidrug DMT transporter permease [Providencia rettgeri]MBQ0403824.1 multidrug DMT transporter permease [Providencia rettgeri]